MKRLPPILLACLLLLAPAAWATTYTNSSTGQQSPGTVLECGNAATTCGSDGIVFTPTVQTAAYVSGNALGSLQTISIARTTNQPSGLINWFSVLSKGGATPALTVYLFDSNPTGTTCTDKTAFVMGASDRSKLIGIPFVLTPGVQGTGDTATYAINQGMGLQFKNHDATATTDIYVCTVTGTGFTPASTTDIAEKIGISQD